MPEQNVQNSISQIFKKCFPQFNGSGFEPQASFRKRGLDSLDLANFFLTVEETYTIKIQDEEFDTIDCIRDTSHIVTLKLQGKN